MAALSAKLEDTKAVLQQLYSTISNVETDRAALAQECENVNVALETENVPLRAIRECVEVRKQRPTRELVRDEVEYEMQMLEKEHMETCALYQQTLFACTNELKRLEDAHGKLTYDIDHKEETVRLDSEVLGMEVGNPAVEAPNHSSVLPYTWSGTSAELMSYTQDICATAQRLTSKSANIRVARGGIEEEGRQRTLNALAKRMSDTERVAGELKANIDGLTGEIAAGQEEMQTLAAAIDDKTPALDLAKTRLSARVSRPGIERVRDVAERALEAEVMDLSRAIQELALSRERVVANMARLEASREQLSMDLADKEVGLKIDSQCHAKVSAIKY